MYRWKQNVVESSFDHYIDLLSEEYAQEEVVFDNVNMQLMSKDNLIYKEKEKFKEMIQNDEYANNLRAAIYIIKLQGEKYLVSEKWNNILEELNRAASTMNEITPETDLTEFPYIFLGISAESLSGIEQISREKYKEDDLDSVIALCTLLTTLNPFYPHYWLELGVAFQDKGAFHQALTSYAISRTLDPKLVECWIFSAECYWKEGLLHDAQVELDHGKKLAENEHSIWRWQPLIEDLDQSIKMAA